MKIAILTSGRNRFIINTIIAMMAIIAIVTAKYVKSCSVMFDNIY